MAATTIANQNLESAPVTTTDYDVAVDDFLRDLDVQRPHGTNDFSTTTGQLTKDVDEEVTVKKKRQPVPKLDETRLLSDAGVPKLRKVARTKLQFRGKGREFSDIARLLNTYQLWLDDLYPRAKFRDALTMVEKIGHSKRMQMARRAWMDATKPSSTVEDGHMSGEDGGRDVNETDPHGVAENTTRVDTGTPKQPETGTATKVSQASDVPEDDDLEALLAAPGAERRPPQAKAMPFGVEEDDQASEDDLDALMAEQPVTKLPPGSALAVQPQKPDFHEFADEEEIMAGMDW